jgi:PHD/YefM family antitoxin component YafN of YafNO toxin-antitoxin module
MIATQHTQSLTDFRQRATETLDRLRKTGEAQILTVNGEARAVLLAPATFDELARDAQLTRDVAVMRRSMQQIDAGEGMPAEEYFCGLRARLQAMKATNQTKAKRKGKSR